MTDREALLQTQMGQRFLKKKMDEARNEARNEAMNILMDALLSSGQTKDAVANLLRQKYSLTKKKAYEMVNAYNPM